MTIDRQNRQNLSSTSQIFASILQVRQVARFREMPPTAGLPLVWRDFIPSGASLENCLSVFLQLPEVQVECSGTAAFIVALNTLKRLSNRRSIIIPAYTCPLIPLAISHCGLTPVLCDVRRNHFDFCPKTLASLCGEDTLAIIPTHLGGRVADLATIMEIAHSVGAYIVEDAAQALGASWQGQPVGSLGDAGFYSLGVGKGLTIYGGGVLVARDEHLRRLLHETSTEIAPYRASWEIRRLLELAGYAALYRPAGMGIAYGLPLRRALKKGKLIEAVGDDYSANIPLHRVGAWRKVIGAHALNRLPAFFDMTSAQAVRRKPMLSAIPGISVIDDIPGSNGTWPYFLVLMPTQQSRDNALSHLWQAGLGVGRLFIHALPDYPYLTSSSGYVATPNAQDFAARLLTITNSPWLEDRDFKGICATLANQVA